MGILNALGLADEKVEERANYVGYGSMPVPSPWMGWPTEWTTPLWGDRDWETVFTKVSTVFACVDINAKALSSMPIQTRRGTDVIPNRLWVDNPEPMVYQHGGEAMVAIVVSLLMRGNAYIGATAVGADGLPQRWVVIDPDVVAVTNVNGERQYKVKGKDLDGTLCHIRYMTWPGRPSSPSPLCILAYNIGAAGVLEQYGYDLAARGGLPASVLKHPQKLNSDQARDLQANWVDAAGQRNGAPAVLSGGIEFETLSLSPADMALLDIRTLSEQRICATLNQTPPPLVGLPGADSLTYSTTVQLLDTFWRLSLSPLGRNIMRGLSNWALPAGERLDLLEDEFTRPGGLELGQLLETLIRAGIIEPEEARQSLGFSSTSGTGPVPNLSVIGGIST